VVQVLLQEAGKTKTQVPAHFERSEVTAIVVCSPMFCAQMQTCHTTCATSQTHACAHPRVFKASQEPPKRRVTKEMHDKGMGMAAKHSMKTAALLQACCAGDAYWPISELGQKAWRQYAFTRSC
jgi:hypothetical protein